MAGIFIITVFAIFIFMICNVVVAHALNKSQLQKIVWQKTLLVYFLCVYILPSLYRPLWEMHEIYSFGILCIITSVVGMVWHLQSDGMLQRTIAGGLLGSQLSLLYHLILSYTTLAYFEDTNLGFQFTFIVLSPFAAIFGSAFGFLAWLAVRVIKWGRTCRNNCRS